MKPRFWRLAALVLSVWGLPVQAQDRIRTMPGYDRYLKAQQRYSAVAIRSGDVGNVKWTEDGKAVEYSLGQTRWRFDIGTKRASEIPQPKAEPYVPDPDAPGRARTRLRVFSPDQKLVAFHRDRNLWIRAADSSWERAVTTEGNDANRKKFGTGTWVYSEELYQNTAMWWSPDGKKLAYYGFDESQIPDFPLGMGQLDIQSRIHIEAYPKAGGNNPIVTLYVYDLDTKQSTPIDIRMGRPFENDVIGYYTYKIRWSPDGSELLMFRTNRLQNTLDFTACNPTSGACRAIVREEWPASWVATNPALEFLSDGKRFIWPSERNGFRNFYLYDLSGRLVATLTNHTAFDARYLMKVDEKRRELWYQASDGDNHMKAQVHRVGLDGKGDVRLTDPRFDHQVYLSPNGDYFVDVAQTHRDPPTSRLIDRNGKVIAILAESDTAAYRATGLVAPEMFTFKAADSTTILHGMLYRPSDFDSTKKYPVLMSIYAGPHTNGAHESFSMWPGVAEFGFLVVNVDARSAVGRGKRSLDAIYRNLGVVEIDDLAAGIKALSQRPYVDATRVGITGASYGGYASIMAILRYPDVFHAAAASSPVTDWRHYDTIYTERYMGLPQDNTKGYDAGSAMTHVDNLRGRLIIWYGTADDNVHPNNSMGLIRALQKAGKRFEVMVGPDAGHGGLDSMREMEFFIEHLMMKRVPIDN